MTKVTLDVCCEQIDEIVLQRVLEDLKYAVEDLKDNSTHPDDRAWRTMTVIGAWFYLQPCTLPTKRKEIFEKAGIDLDYLSSMGLRL